VSTHAVSIGWSTRVAGYVQLAKLRVYQHLYEWLLLALLLDLESVHPPGTTLALALVLVTMVAVQATACSIDDIIGFRDGSDAENYRANALLATPAKLLPKPLLTGLLTERQAIGFAAVAVTTTVVAALGAVAAIHGDIPAAAPLGYLLVIVCALQYSWGLKLSYRPGGLELVIVVVNSCTLLLPYWSAAHSVSPLVAMMSVLVAVWFLLVVCYGNAADREGDEAAGRRTFAVVASPELYRGFLVALYLASVALTILPFALGYLRPAGLAFVVPLLAMHTAQVYLGAIRGEYRRAMRIGFRSVDLGGLGFAAAIILS
jgi:1,4-dihydroxy-2-naphthoate polyprenyltransferase